MSFHLHLYVQYRSNILKSLNDYNLKTTQLIYNIHRFNVTDYKVFTLNI